MQASEVRPTTDDDDDDIDHRRPDLKTMADPVTAPFRIAVTAIFTLTAVPKLLMWGRTPSRLVRDQLAGKRAAWLDMEVGAAAYTWKTAFGYPALLLRPVGAALLTAVVFLNVYPPPAPAGYRACFFLVMVLGGGLWTWLVNYRSPRHCVPLFATLLMLTVIASVKADVKAGEVLDPAAAWVRALLGRTVLPLVLGFAGGPVFKYLGKLEQEHRD